MIIKIKTKEILISLVIFLCYVSPVCCATITIGDAEAQAGSQNIILPINMELAPADQISAMNLEITYNSSNLTFNKAIIGQVCQDAQKTIAFNSPSAGVVRIVIYGLNQNTISDGIIGNLDFNISEEALGNQSMGVFLNEAAASDPSAQAVSLTLDNGSIMINDSIAPAAISNLTALNPDANSLNLNWTAPGDDATTGTVSNYAIRYSTSQITEANWDLATQADNPPTPKSAGTMQTCVVSSLSAETTYYFAIKSYDEAGNASGLSNVAVAATNTGNSPHIDSASVQIEQQEKGVQVIFAAETSDADGKVIKYEWDFDGKGVYDYSSKDSAACNYLYTTPGEYRAVLRIIDNDGQVCTKEVRVVVPETVNTPSLSIAATQTTGQAPLKTKLTASVDNLQEIVLYEWDINGDGVYDKVIRDGAELIVVYKEPGDFQPTVRITNAQGYKNAASIAIEVKANANMPDLNLTNTSPLRGKAPLDVQFNVVSSGANIIKYEFDFEANGVYEYCTKDNPNIIHKYCEPGTYEAKVRVTNAEGLSKTETVQIRIGLGDGDSLPDLTPQAASIEGNIPLQLTPRQLLGDKPSSLLKYEIDFNGDGRIDICCCSEDKEYTFKVPGVYLARVNIWDNNNIRNKIIIPIKANYNLHAQIPDDEQYYPNTPIEINAKEDVKVEITDGAECIVPFEALDASGQLLIAPVNKSNVLKELIDVDDHNIKPIDKYYSYTIENASSTFRKDVTIGMHYPDLDNDGIVDGTQISEETIRTYYYDETTGTWARLRDIVIFTDINKIQVKVNHFTLFGIGGEVIDGGDNGDDGDTAPTGGGSTGSGGGGGCFIATACYGTLMAEPVQVLCKFRDRYLLTNFMGKVFVKVYYKYSPPVADYIRNKDSLKNIIRMLLTPLVKFSKVLVE